MLRMARRPKPAQAEQVPMNWHPPRYTIVDAFRLLCRRTNGHGWGRIVRATSHGGACCWFVITWVCVLMALISAYVVTVAYEKQKSELSIRFKKGQEIPFPAVTICNNNPVQFGKIDQSVSPRYIEKLNKIPENILRLLNSPEYYINKLRSYEPKGGELDVHDEAFRNLVIAGRFTTLSDKKALGYSAKDLVAYCSFKGKICDFTTESRHFYDDAYGNCYTFNFQGEDSNVEPGIDAGLHLILRVYPKEYLPYYTESEGMKVLIHEPLTMPLPSVEAKSVTSGFETEIGLERVEYSRLKEPYEDECVDDFKSFHALLGYSYTTKACYVVCKQLVTVEECDCADERLAPVTHKTCNTTGKPNRETVACLEKVDYRFSTDPDGACQCPQACKEAKFPSLISYSNFPPQNLKSRFHTIYGLPYEKTASVRVYYRSGQTTHYDNIPMNSDYEFFGLLGAQIFSWTGASLITGYELLLFLITAILIVFTEHVDWLMDDYDHE